MDHSSNSQEDAEGFGWDESKWQKFLKTNQQQTDCFLNLYSQPRKDHDHLSQCALQMGWDKIADFKAELTNNTDFDEEPHPGFYTIHQHPVFMASRALMVYIGKAWHESLSKPQDNIPAVIAWSFLGNLHSIELNVILGLFAEDCADFALAVCHLKNALSGLNFSLKTLQHIRQNFKDIHTQALCQNTQATLFDMRNIWLEAISHCRYMQKEILTQEDEANESSE